MVRWDLHVVWVNFLTLFISNVLVPAALCALHDSHRVSFIFNYVRAEILFVLFSELLCCRMLIAFFFFNSKDVVAKL